MTRAKIDLVLLNLGGYLRFLIFCFKISERENGRGMIPMEKNTHFSLSCGTIIFKAHSEVKNKRNYINAAKKSYASEPTLGPSTHKEKAGKYI